MKMKIDTIRLHKSEVEIAANRSNPFLPASRAFRKITDPSSKRGGDLTQCIAMQQTGFRGKAAVIIAIHLAWVVGAQCRIDRIQYIRSIDELYAVALSS